MTDWILAFINIMIINIILSGDNAVVIAMASRNLPDAQRKKAVWWGSFGAIFLRVVLTLLATYLLQIPLLKAVGAALLIWIAMKLLVEEENHNAIRGSSSLGGAVWTIIVADFVMSLDNVIAIAGAAKGDITLILLGLGLSIPLIVWGSSVVMRLLQKYPILIYIGAGILGYTAGEMFVTDEKIIDLIIENNPSLEWIIPIGATLAVILLGAFWRMNKSGHPRTS